MQNQREIQRKGKSAHFQDRRRALHHREAHVFGAVVRHIKYQCAIRHKELDGYLYHEIEPYIARTISAVSSGPLGGIIPLQAKTKANHRNFYEVKESIEP